MPAYHSVKLQVSTPKIHHLHATRSKRSLTSLSLLIHQPWTNLCLTKCQRNSSTIMTSTETVQSTTWVASATKQGGRTLTSIESKSELSPHQWVQEGQVIFSVDKQSTATPRIKRSPSLACSWASVGKYCQLATPSRTGLPHTSWCWAGDLKLLMTSSTGTYSTPESIIWTAVATAWHAS